MSETKLQFGERLTGPATPPPQSQPCPTRCPRCGHHFTDEGRFCPFDGEPLVRAVDWDPSGDPLLDRVVDGRYQVEAVIGEGGMGTVYRIRHVLLGKRLALKALRADLATDGEIAERFIHEARTAASVSHPGLVQISDFGTLPTGQAYFVMELLEGLSLSALLRRYGALSPLRASRIAGQIADAVDVAHVAGIVHRDLKPDNIHLRVTDAGDEVKVVDFGLARVAGSARLTRTGIVFGTPHYMSPEQASGETLDARTDVYALGVVLYEMLTGRVPFEADTYMGVLTQHIYMKPPSISERLGRPAGIETLEALVLRCLEKSPARRPISMKELSAALAALPSEELQGQALLSDPLGGGVQPVVFVPQVPIEPAAPRLPVERPWWVLAGAGFALAALALLVWIYVSGQDAEPVVAASAVPSVGAAPVPSQEPTLPPTAAVATGAPAPTTSAAPSALPAPAARQSAGPRVKPTPRPKNAMRTGEIIDPWARP